MEFIDDLPPAVPAKAVSGAGAKAKPATKSGYTRPKNLQPVQCPNCDEVLPGMASLNAHTAKYHHQSVPEKPWTPGDAEVAEQQLAGRYDLGRARLFQHYSVWLENDRVIRAKATHYRKQLASWVVLGIDASVRSTGLSFLEAPSGDSLSLTLEPTGTGLQERMASIKNGLYRALRDEWDPLPMLAVMERGFSAPIKGANSGPSATKLGMVQGVILSALDELQIPCFVLSPKTVKKFATGNGNATKDQVLEAAMQQLGLESSGPLKKDLLKDYDRADSLWLAHIGGLTIDGFDSGTEYEYEQLEYFNTIEYESVEDDGSSD